MVRTAEKSTLLSIQATIKTTSEIRSINQKNQVDRFSRLLVKREISAFEQLHTTNMSISQTQNFKSKSFHFKKIYLVGKNTFENLKIFQYKCTAFNAVIS